MNPHPNAKHSSRRLRWSPLATMALPAVLLLALDGGPAEASQPKAKGKPEAASSKPTAASKPAPSASKRKGLNSIDGLTVEELDDGTTILRLAGTSEPTFNVYRLPDPDRLVVDISNSSRGEAVPHVDIDSWAVGRVTIGAVEESESQVARVVVHLKREASYIVVPKHNELVITVTPKEVAPEAYFARKSAGKRKAEIESMKADAESKVAAAEKKAKGAEERADEAEQRAADAKVAAEDAEKEAARIRAEADTLAAKAQAIEDEAAKKAAELEDQARKKAAEIEDEAAELEQEARKNAKKVEDKAAKLEEQARKRAEELEDEAATTLAEARELAAARKKVLDETETRIAKAEKKALAAEKRAAEAKAAAEAAEAEAIAIREAAANTKREAEDLLADAEEAMAQAREDQAQAKAAFADAKQALGEARKASRKLRKVDEEERAQLERALAQAEAAADAAKQREEDATARLAALEKDRAELDGALAAKRDELPANLGQTEQELADAREALDQAWTRYQQVGGERGPAKDNKREHRKAKQALHKAEQEYAKQQAEAEEHEARITELHSRIAAAEQQLDDTLTNAKRQRSLSKEWEDERALAGIAAVRDVRFEDGPRGSRVVVELDGPVVYDASSLTPNMTMLELRDTEIPSTLERSLDTTSFNGPIDRITSFREGEDVKIVVASATSGPAELTLDKQGNRLIWTFPRTTAEGGGDDDESTEVPTKRSEVVSLGGNKVSGFSNKLPSADELPLRAAPPRGTNVGSRTRWRGERIDIELQDAPIKDVLLLFSDIGRVNIIAGPEVQGTVTMKLSSVPWDQALDIILRSLQLGMVQEGNVIRVATQAELEEERRKAIEQANAQVQLKPLETRLIPLSYATVQDMLPKVQSVLSSRGTVTPDSRTNTLIVMDVGENIALAESLVRQLDSQTPQVLIEARIVEARTNWLRQLGIQWGFDFIASPGTGNPTGLLFPNSIGVGGGSGGNLSPTRGLILPGAAANPHYAVDLPATVATGTGGAIGFSFGSLSGNLNTNLRLSAAEEEGEVRIISAPKIVTLDNTEAQIEQGVQIPISQVSAQGVNTRYVNATLGLRVTPHVTNEGAVMLEVAVQKNEADFVNTGARGDPTILTKSANSQLLITDGDTAVIGGIYTRNQGLNKSKVPWFADIPIIGWFFKNTIERDDRSEMLIFLTPRIVNRSTSIGGGG